MQHVQGWGAHTARLVLIGEAPGEQEELKGEPFVGASGYRLQEWWAKAGLRRDQFRIENVYEYRPPHNNIEAVSQADLEAWMRYLHERIAALADPWILIPTGNYALYALTGKGRVKWHTKQGQSSRSGITQWRGSILTYTDQRGRTIKVIPTLHPAMTFRSPSDEAVCIHDWRKIAQEATTREVHYRTRTHDTRPTYTQLEAYLKTLTPQHIVAVDIENPGESGKKLGVPEDTTTPSAPADPHMTTTTHTTPNTTHHPTTTNTIPHPITAPIISLALSHDPEYSLTIPLQKTHWGSHAQLERVWGLLTHFLQDHPCQKVFHNGLYDTFHLQWERGITVNPYTYDTLYMHHCLNPSDTHSLDYCASVDTREPFWKHQAKDQDTIASYRSQWEAFLVYNGKDAAITRELYDVYAQRLQAQGLWDFYHAHYADLLTPLQALQQHGIAVNDVTRRLRYAHLMADCIDIQDQLEQHTGLKLYAEKALSTKKLQHYLYTVLGLPEQRRARKAKGDHTVSADELAVRKLMLRYPAKLQHTGHLILTHRRKSKLSECYQDERVDHDGRFRSSYSMNTEAGRLSSSANPNRTGSNAQNVDRETRDVFIADPGHVLVEVDLSQAEARIDYALIYMLTGHQAMYDRARLRPDEYDQHTENASYIFNKPTAEITEHERYLGKKAVHGAFRDMQGKKLSDELLKEGFTLDPLESQRMITAFRERVSGIDELFRWVRRRMIEDRQLVNSWGRRLLFTDDRLTDETYRRGYSFDPQSEVADWMNQFGLKPFYRYLDDLNRREGRVIGSLNVHAHDALVFSVLPAYAYAATRFLVQSLEQPRVMRGVTLSIPCEIKVGHTWKGSAKWKRLPTQEEFDHASHTRHTGLST